MAPQTAPVARKVIAKTATSVDKAREMEQASERPGLTLAIIVTPNFNMATTVGFLDPFRAANYLDGSILFRWSLVSATGGEVMASNGLSIGTIPLRDIRHRAPDIAVVSSSWTPEAYSSAPLQSALARWARAGVTLGALETGTFILADAGLLQGKRATTHYEHMNALRELYPATEAVEALFVEDGKLMTCCGGTASTDLALHIIRRWQSSPLASAAAQFIFHHNPRIEGAAQGPGALELPGSSIPSVIRQAIKLMEENLEEALSIAQICKRVRLSQRQLDRLFSQHVRKNPALYYRDMRLDRARCLITQTQMRLSEIAVASGFSSQAHFSRTYKERFGLAPRTDRIEGRVPFELRAWPMYRK